MNWNRKWWICGKYYSFCGKNKESEKIECLWTRTTHWAMKRNQIEAQSGNDKHWNYKTNTSLLSLFKLWSSVPNTKRIRYIIENRNASNEQSWWLMIGVGWWLLCPFCMFCKINRLTHNQQQRWLTIDVTVYSVQLNEMKSIAVLYIWQKLWKKRMITNSPKING